MTTAIVGAGAAGLSLALMLDDDVTIFEKEDHPGGLCRSTTVEDSHGRRWVWDKGPHILGGIPEAVQWIKDTTNVEFVKGKTNNIGFKNHYIPHPFTFESDGLAYMEKMWKLDPAQLSLDGLGAQKNRKPGGVSTFLYPERGGYQAITDAWAAQLNVKCGETFRGGDYDRVVWTAPISSPNVRYNTLWTVTACVWGPRPSLTAIYLPDRSTPFHRLSFPASFSPNNAPADDGFIIQAEMTSPYFPMDLERAKQESILIEDFMSLVGRFDFVESYEGVYVDVIPYAYPVPTKASAGTMEWAKEYRRFILHGRSGGFQYLNVDGVVAASMKLAKELNA